MSRGATKERIEKSSERLNKVLDEVFYGDKKLLAFVCGTNLVTLYGWLNGKHAPTGLGMFRLSQCVPSYSCDYLEGRTDVNTPHRTEYWENIPFQQQSDIFRRDTVLLRELVANRARIHEYRSKVNHE